MSDEMIIWGVLASIVFQELTQISPGGIIVPGYIALLLDDPWRVAVTIGLSLLTWGGVRLLSAHVILFGRRRFAVFIIVSFLLRFAFGLVAAETGAPVSAAMVIGYLVPGILAHEIERQGAVKTLTTMLIVALALKLLFIGFIRVGGG